MDRNTKRLIISRIDKSEKKLDKIIDFVRDNGSTINAGIIAIDRINDLLDGFISDMWVLLNSKPACKSGCWYCCTLPLDVTSLELLHIVKYIQENFSKDDIEILLQKAKSNALAVHGKRGEQYPRVDCAFLKNGKCSIYSARPFACRYYHDCDVTPCKISFETKSDVPSHRNMIIFNEARQLAYRANLELSKINYDTSYHELQQSLFHALSSIK